MTIFSINNLGKAFKDKILFEGVSFGMDTGDRIGLIGRNGIGKSTLLKIIAGIESPDEGTVVFNNNVRFEYLDQSPEYDKHTTALDSVMQANQEIYDLLSEYDRLSATSNDINSAEFLAKMEALTRKLDSMKGWNLENEAKKILSILGINDFYELPQNFSGGFKKRVALAKSLISSPDLLILDEPTNHLDVDSVQWLQDRLISTGISLLFVTHDRYFLDALSTRIIELDKRKLFTYNGNYENYLERKEEQSQIDQAELENLKNKIRTELAWLQRGARARRTKQKSRIDWIKKLREDFKPQFDKKIKIELGKTFLGSRIIDAHNITKSISGKLLFNNFTYLAKPKDRIGIIGPNGCGKTTFLNVLAGIIKPDEGTVKIGANIKLGFLNQEVVDMKDDSSVIGTLREIAEYIDVGEGRERYLTARDLLNKFLFPGYQHSALVGTLSGGEKRRLALLRVLMNNPNVLLLDEPTNDFDIQTLGALEDYLDDFYGTYIVVSHDRAFLDRTVNFIWAFDGEGGIKEYPGNYSAYLERKENEPAAQFRKEESPAKSENNRQKSKIKLSYLEQREYDQLEQLIPELEMKKSSIESVINDGHYANYQELENLSHELVKIDNDIENALNRLIELEESISG